MRLYILHRVHEIVYLCETIFRSFQIFTTTLQRTPAGSGTVDNVFCLDFVFGFYAVRLKQGECRPTDDTGEHFFTPPKIIKAAAAFPMTLSAMNDPLRKSGSSFNNR